MTAVAQLHLCFRKEKLRRGRRVDGVTICAHHIVFGVGGAPDVGAGKGLGVTAQAVVQDLFRLQLGKSDYGRLSAVGRYVRFPRTMATFTSGVVGRLLPRCHALEVRVLIEFRRDVGMARLTSLAAHETARRITLDQAGWLLREG